MKRLFTPFNILLFTHLIIGCSKDETPATPSTTYTKVTLPYKQVSGVDVNLLSLDLYHFGTTNATKPVVVYVHGGAWAVGDKANSISNKTNLFSSLGYVFVSVNYRLSPSTASSDPNRIKFPTHSEDVADAVKWLYDNIATYGGDKQKMVLLGHSAGAHLVSLTGTSAQFLPAKGISLSALKGVASIDTEGYDVATQCNEGNDTYLNAFGSNSADWTKASPIAQVVSGTVYPRFFIAKRGTTTRIAISDDFITKLQSAGVTVSQVTGSQYDHEGINDAIGAPNETIITEPLKTFLAQCFQ
ncbi:MAG: alpha/beta hydrolase [Cyclobacteriaceae bacterium]|nr:alpha/beta hydrolase [Cyclobacteriaceae bacterium]